MHKAILMMLLAIVNSSAMAEWTEVSSNDDFTIYADLAIMSREDNRVKMWLLDDYRIPQMDDILGLYMSVKEQDELDCKKALLRILYLSFHHENMGRGEEIGIDETLGEWIPVIHETIGEALWKVACGMQATTLK